MTSYKTCGAIEEFCTEKASVKGYCAKHYQRVKKYGTPYLKGTPAHPGNIVEMHIPVYDPSMTVMDAFVYARRRVETFAEKGFYVVQGPIKLAITQERHRQTNAAFTITARMRLEKTR